MATAGFQAAYPFDLKCSRNVGHECQPWHAESPDSQFIGSRRMERQTLAYLLIFLIIAAVSAWGGYTVYHGRERTYRRRLARENAEYKTRRARKVDTL